MEILKSILQRVVELEIYINYYKVFQDQSRIFVSFPFSFPLAFPLRRLEKMYRNLRTQGDEEVFEIVIPDKSIAGKSPVPKGLSQ